MSHSASHNPFSSSSSPDDGHPTPRRRPPPPPPQHTHRTRAMPAATPNEVRDAVRETVKYRRESSERTRPSRSATTTYVVCSLSPASHPHVPHSTQPAINPKPTGRRSNSEDAIQEKPRASGGKSRPKKGSQHADVIDRLDFTGVGPSTYSITIRAFACIPISSSLQKCFITMGPSTPAPPPATSTRQRRP
jgi:hypothetical protein